MGCDGGTIPGRKDLVKTRKVSAAAVAAAAEVAPARWSNCAISNERLRAPVVACALGHLYNKDALIHHLLQRSSSSSSSAFNHVRSLKDTQTLCLYFPPEAKNAGASAASDPVENSGVFWCPITFMHANGKHRFVLSRSCGCVLSEKAVKEVPSHACLACQKPLADNEAERFLVLNPTDPEEIEAMRERMLRAKAKQDLEDQSDNKRKRKKKKMLKKLQREESQKRKQANADGDGNASSSSKRPKVGGVEYESEVLSSIFLSSKKHRNKNVIDNPLFGNLSASTVKQ